MKLAVLAAALATCVFSSTKVWEAWCRSVRQTTSPVSLTEARKFCRIPLPDSARNIQVAVFSDWENYQCFVRFEDSSPECARAIEPVFRSHAKDMKWKYAAPKIKVITEAPVLDVTPQGSLRVDWFDIANIKHGITAGWQPQVWVDNDRGAFYFCLTD